MTFIIAEAGVNHNGSIDTAMHLIDQARAVGADAVKFQTFDAVLLDPPGARRKMLSDLLLDRRHFVELARYAEERDLEFMSTPFDPDSLKFLVEECGIKRIKIASGNLDNWPMLDAAALSGLPILLSTGMATIDEIRRAWFQLVGWPGMRVVTFLHCTSAYPCPPDAVNLRAITTMREEFEQNIGFSDHTKGVAAAPAAVALGATVIEKHMTLDKAQEGPDHAASLEPSQFRSMVLLIREAETMLGDGIKRPQAAEAAVIKVVQDRKAWRERDG